MGAAARMFFSAADADTQTLHKRITLSERQFEDQQERWNLLADHLVTRLANNSGCVVQTWLQGSYKFGTQVRPPKEEEYDIDLGVYFVWEGSAEEGKFGSDDLRALAQLSLGEFALGQEGEVIEVAEPKARCLRIRYSGGFHIDVSVYHLTAKGDVRTLATEEGWSQSDPKSIYLWFRDSFSVAARDRVRRCLRYLKAWQGLRFSPDARISSIALTVLVADAALSLDEGAYGPEDEFLATIVCIICRRLRADPYVANPVDRSEDLNRLNLAEGASFLKGLVVFHDAALLANANVSEVEAAVIWQGHFGHLFPMPELGNGLSIANLPMIINTAPQIRVEARASEQGKVFSGQNGIGPVPKDCRLTFSLSNAHQFPVGTTALWMVRNEGEEAEDSNDLGHFAGEGLSVSRDTAYRGTHYMDCIVKLGLVTLAIRRVPVVISGVGLPLRNPKMRPIWVRNRGKR